MVSIVVVVFFIFFFKKKDIFSVNMLEYFAVVSQLEFKNNHCYDFLASDLSGMVFLRGLKFRQIGIRLLRHMQNVAIYKPIMIV
jgi:hypothetical protein